MTVTPEDRDAMARLMQLMEGKTVPSPSQPTRAQNREVELAGPGAVTQADIHAMADVMSRLNSISNKIVNDMITESTESPMVAEALKTEKTPTGVKVGRYQIMIKEDQKRLAGKQYYSIYNSITGDTIADDISLYESALAAVRLLNDGKFANSPEIRKIFETDDQYTSHRVDALIYKRKINTTTDMSKREIFESRYQASLDRCMAAKKNIKILAK